MNTRLPMNRKLLTLILLGISAAFMAACGSGNSTNAVVIGFSQAPPAVLQTSTVTALDAVVSNDTSNAGVDWTVTCGGSDCGSFSPTHTASGVSTNYTAPATVPNGNTVTITATATANTSAIATGTVTITTSSTAGGLNGQYSFLVSGADPSLFYVAVGSVIADGNGNITGGEEDLCDLSGCATAILSGTYATGDDGRGSINVSSTNFGPQTLQVAVTSPSHALIIEFDGNATSSGSLDLQDTTAFSGTSISGNYSMAMNGLDITNIAEEEVFPAALGGIMTADGAGGFTNVTLDVNDGGTVSSEPTVFGATAGPDSFGRVVISDPNFEFVYYIVNAKALRLIEADESLFVTSGSAYTQGTGSLTVANLAGTSVFAEEGSTINGSLGLAGEMTVDNNGNGTAGFMDANDFGSVTNGSITGSTFSNFTAARGQLTLAGNVSSNVADFQVYLVDPGVNILDPTNATGGGGALLLDVDSNAIGTGEIIPQTVGAQFSGDYGVNLQAFTTSTSTNPPCVECDLVGQVQASASNLTGTGDLNNYGTLVAAQALTGSFTADSSNPGRFTGSLNLATFGTFNLVYYQATNSQLVIVEVDTGEVATGVIEEQQ